MKFYSFKVKIRDKNNKYDKILELLKLSNGNNITNLNYNKNKIKYPNQSSEIFVSYDKKYIKKNNGKMIYDTIKYKEIRIFNKDFITNNIKRAKMIINNKQCELKEYAKTHKQSFKIKIKFLDIIIYLNCMFKHCKYLFGVYNFQNFNSKYIKAIYDLFEGCNSLIYIDDISNWDIKNINYYFFN